MKNIFVQYAKNHKITVAEAIADRDEPMTMQVCISEFEEATGRKPTEEEIRIMRPDSQETVRKQILYYME